MHQVTKEFMESLETREELIEFINDVIDKRNKKEKQKEEEYQELLRENIILKDKLTKIRKIINRIHEEE